MPHIDRKVIAPGNRIRALVVDDSAVIRRLVTHALEEDGALELAGVAPNGAVALAKIPQLNPDVVTLDIEMPEMDGLETLRRIRKNYPLLRVVMFSTRTERGAALTLDALALGADDYVTKASNEGSLDRSMARLRSELIPKIKQFFVLASGHVPPTAVAAAAVPPRIPSASAALLRPRVVVIGVSTGGPNALNAIIPQFPPNFPVPVLIVQHMPPLFTRLLAERLQTNTGLRVSEAVEGIPLEPGMVVIAPGDYHMQLSKAGGQPRIALNQEPPENSCRPAVDVLFRSTAEVYGGAVIAVILTGMGYDGLRGAKALKAGGAHLIAQDEASSVVWGMPGAVVQAGLADAVLPLDQIVPAILARMGRLASVMP